LKKLPRLFASEIIKKKEEIKMKKSILRATAAFFAVFLIAGSFYACNSKDKPIVVGAKDYTEQDVLGNIVSILLESNTDLPIEYKHEMSSNVLFAAIKSGSVDLCVDYTGTIYGNYLDYSESKSADEVFDISKREMAEKFALRLLDPLGFNNTYCLAVRPETAERYNLSTYSDLAKVSSELKFGGGFEILNRNDGIPNLKKVYEMEFKEEIAVEGALRYSAIEKDETQITEAFSTDGMLLEYNLTVLQDDKSFFPPYHAVTVIREETANEYPQILTELSKLADLIDDDTMRGLNYKVDVLKENARDVARDFLVSSMIIDET
jgi:osmoprotectant transport system permease protein